MRKIIVVLLITFSPACFAQQISQSVIAAAGSSSDILPFTTGDLVINTTTSGTVYLTQGFQQPQEPDGSTEPNRVEAEKTELSYSVYPVPLENYFNLEIKTAYTGEISPALFDATGNLIEKYDPFSVQNGHYLDTFSVSEIPEGNYLLRLTDKEGVILTTINLVVTQE